MVAIDQRPAHDEIGIARERRGWRQRPAEAPVENALGVGACRVEHQAATDLEAAAAERVARGDAAHTPLPLDQAGGLDVVGADRARSDRALDIGQHQPRRIVHLAVAENAGARQALAREAGVAAQRLLAANEARARDPAPRVGDAPIAVGGQEIVGGHARPQHRLALHSPTIGRDHNRQRLDEMRGRAQECRSRPCRLTHAGEISVL